LSFADSPSRAGTIAVGVTTSYGAAPVVPTFISAVTVPVR
jgi:hypothetical protein